MGHEKPRKIPIITQRRWLYTLPQLALLALALILGLYLGGYPVGLLVGGVAYLACSRGVRSLLTRHHKAGMRNIRQHHWTEALSRFRESQVFFERFPWIDRFRSFLLLSDSAAGYHEMALINQAFCLLHLDQRAEARKIYEQVLEIYPESQLASRALEAVNAGAMNPADSVSGQAGD